MDGDNHEPEVFDLRQALEQGHRDFQALRERIFEHATENARLRAMIRELEAQLQSLLRPIEEFGGDDDVIPAFLKRQAT